MAEIRSPLYRESHGAGQDLVMVHGWGMHSGVWRDFAFGLSATYRVILVDLPGHGRSAPIDDWTLEGVSRALLAAFPGRVIWLGWSMGATLVLHLAARFPECVEKVVLVAGNAKFVGDGLWPGMEPSMFDAFAAALARDPPGTLARFSELQARGEASERSVLKALRKRLAECPPPGEATLRAGISLLRDSDLRGALSRMSCPGLLLHGAGDALVPASAGRAMQASWRGSRLQVMDRAGHVPFLSHPRDTAASILEFLDQPSPERL